MDTTYVYSTYLAHGGVELFTIVCLPEKNGKFPTVIMRSPYVDGSEDADESALEESFRKEQEAGLRSGYAVVFQHCRGRGKSSGDCIPFVYEREDGLFLQEWIRRQSFYNGELFLVGGSYTAMVHYMTTPFAPDIKGAVLMVADSNWYNCSYRNGFFKASYLGGWYMSMYKHKSIPHPSFVLESFQTRPLSGFSEAIFGERAEIFEKTLLHPDGADPFWDTVFGENRDRNAIRNAGIPILLVTGFYDIFAGGIFKMWNGLDEETKKKSALLVHPYDHGADEKGQPVQFEGASLSETFGNFPVRWMEYVRGKEESPFTLGTTTYYQLFGGRWMTGDVTDGAERKTFPLGTGERTYVYNPYAPAVFPGGLTTDFGGTAWQPAPDFRYDVLSWFTPAFEKDTFVKGKMRVKLRVRSDCEDTCFYVRLSLVKEEGAYGLRDDIQQISNFTEDYVPGSEIDLDFTFDEHAFVIGKGEKLRIDVSSSATQYVSHANRRGLYSLQESARIAHNTVIADQSSLTIPAE